MNVYLAIILGFLVWCVLATLAAAVHHVAKVASQRHRELSADHVIIIDLRDTPTPHVPDQRTPHHD